MERLTRFVLTHRQAVAATWLVVTLIGIGLSGAAAKSMDQKFTVPGKEGWETNVTIAERFGQTGGNEPPLLGVVTVPAGSYVAAPQTDLKVMATGLAAGILIDATVVRALLVPAVVSLFGRWNWVLPACPPGCSEWSPRCPRRSRRQRRPEREVRSRRW